MTQNAKSEDDDGFWANVKNCSDIMGFTAGIALLMSLAWAVVLNPRETIDKAKEAVSYVFNSSSKGSVALPDCKVETSKTVVVEGQAYKILCEP